MDERTLPSCDAFDLFDALYHARSVNDRPALALFADQLELSRDGLARAALELEAAGLVWLWRTQNPYTWAASVYEHAFPIAERISEIPGYLPRRLRRSLPRRASALSQ